MMEAADFGNRDDRAELRRLDASSVGGILVEREVSPCAVIVREVPGQDTAQVAFAQHEDMIEALARRIDPMSRSAKGFSQGLWGAVRTSVMPMPSMHCRKASP